MKKDYGSNFYVYIIMDLREKWIEKYDIEGVEISPSYRPILIGKGIGERMNCHILEILNKGTHSNPLFLNYVKNMILENGGPTTITTYLFSNLNEEVAYKLEEDSIRIVKRKFEGGPLLNIAPGGRGGPRFENLSVEGQNKMLEGCKKGGSIGGPKTINNARNYIDREKQKDAVRNSEAVKQAGRIWGPINIKKVSKEQLAINGRMNIKKVSRETLVQNGKNVSKLCTMEIRIENGRRNVGIMNQKKDFKYLKSIEHLLPYKDMILNWRDIDCWTLEVIACKLNEMKIERQGFKGKTHTKGSVNILIRQFRKYQNKEELDNNTGNTV